MRKFLGYSPPFSTFLIEMLNTGRIGWIEKFDMDGAAHGRAGSG